MFRKNRSAKQGRSTPAGGHAPIDIEEPAWNNYEVSIRPGFSRHILTVGSGGIATQLLTVVTIPLITRLYAPDAYAGWALLMSVIIIFTSVATLRYELAIVLPKTHDEAANVLVVCVLSTIITFLCATIILLVWGKWLIGGKFYEEMRGWIWSVPPLITFTGVYQASIWWCTRTQEHYWTSGRCRRYLRFRF
ncbi:MAG: lipopolysaccharide biosynthesis protein [Syntrophales bacterium]